MKYLFSFIPLILLLFLLLASQTAFAKEEPLIEIEVPSFFRVPTAILWTYQGEGSHSYVIEMRYGIESSGLLPNIFGDIGLIPNEIVGDVIYESNPDGETGDAIWSKVTAYYDNLFDYDWLEGRAIYRDVAMDSYLGVGLGIAPIDNSWVGGYYLGGNGYLATAELAYPLGDKFWAYGILEYYSDGEWLDGETGIRFNDLIYLSVQNRRADYIYMLGISQPLQ